MVEKLMSILFLLFTSIPSIYHYSSSFLHRYQQMMGPEAMGLVQQHVDWWDPKVCRNYLCGTCPHDVFGNTVSFFPSFLVTHQPLTNSVITSIFNF